MNILDIPIYDDDFLKMVFRFLINFGFLFILIRGIYYKRYHKKEYLFTYFMISFIVFFICFTLKKFELDLGMALGLFAIFGILRYRTDQIQIREMTYLFIVIGISVINALANKKMSYLELLFANTSIVSFTYILEKYWLLKSEVSKMILYDIIENIKPEHYDLLKTDLEERTGLAINRIEVGKIDYSKNVANVKIFYYTSNQIGILGENILREI